MQLDAVIVGDDGTAWSDAGFVVLDGSVPIASTVIECAGDDRSTSWRVWSDAAGLPGDIDGIATSITDEPSDPADVDHPNRVVEIDHIVLQSPDLDRTTRAFAALDVECRRIREIPGSHPAMQQRFFRFGPVILELVGAEAPTGTGPASIWGFAFTVDDIDAAAAHLGTGCGAPKDAVQPGRRIATVRTRELGISSPIALMTVDPRR